MFRGASQEQEGTSVCLPGHVLACAFGDIEQPGKPGAGCVPVGDRDRDVIDLLTLIMEAKGMAGDLKVAIIGQGPATYISRGRNGKRNAAGAVLGWRSANVCSRVKPGVANPPGSMIVRHSTDLPAGRLP